jgi:hypothetical protein
MAFVSIDNPAGIQHHGGQMDWCRVSPTRVAIVTFTADNKALVQEANFNAGATELGPASFLKQVTLRIPTQYTYFKPRIRNLGNDRLFIMVPSTFTPMTTANGIARIFGIGEYQVINPTIDLPYSHTCMIAIRNPDGTYTVDSSIDVRTHAVAEGNAYITQNTPMDIEINPNGLAVNIYQPVAANNTNSRLRMFSTITMSAEGKITGQSVGVANVGAQSASVLSMAIREALTPQLVPLKLHAYNTNTYATPWYSAQNAATCSISRDHWNNPAPDLWPLLAANVNGNYLNINAYLPIDIAAKTFLYMGASPTPNVLGNCYLNGNQINAGEFVRNPLDSAWVTDTVACAIGMAGASGGENPPTYTPPSFDGEVAYSLNPSYDPLPGVNAVRRLSLLFKNIVGAGLYVGPFDPIKTQYYTKDHLNFGPMIHRIDDTAFWLIGCFRDGIGGEDKLGVITVKA